MKKGNSFTIYTKVLLTAVALALFSMPMVAAQQKSPNGGVYHKGAIQSRLAEKVRHELVMLPFYSVFDNLEFRIEEPDTVVLSGQVVRPTLKSGAENVVRRVEGVGKVINQIEVLPLSPYDNRLRLATYRAIFSWPGLDRYTLQAISPIHIIVKNGHITLVGIVASPMDRQIAGMAANGVPGAFSVVNELAVDHDA